MATSAPGMPTDEQGHSVAPRRATFAVWLAEPEEKGAEMIGGRIVDKAFPKPEHVAHTVHKCQVHFSTPIDAWFG